MPLLASLDSRPLPSIIHGFDFYSSVPCKVTKPPHCSKLHHSAVAEGGRVQARSLSSSIVPSNGRQPEDGIRDPATLYLVRPSYDSDCLRLRAHPDPLCCLWDYGVSLSPQTWPTCKRRWGRCASSRRAYWPASRVAVRTSSAAAPSQSAAAVQTRISSVCGWNLDGATEVSSQWKVTQLQSPTTPYPGVGFRSTPCAPVTASSPRPNAMPPLRMSSAQPDQGRPDAQAYGWLGWTGARFSNVPHFKAISGPEI